jgi:hypothetical protein
VIVKGKSSCRAVSDEYRHASKTNIVQTENDEFIRDYHRSSMMDTTKFIDDGHNGQFF